MPETAIAIPGMPLKIPARYNDRGARDNQAIEERILPVSCLVPTRQVLDVLF